MSNPKHSHLLGGSSLSVRKFTYCFYSGIMLLGTLVWNLCFCHLMGVGEGGVWFGIFLKQDLSLSIVQGGLKLTVVAKLDFKLMKINPPASASQMVGSKVWVTIHSSKFSFLKSTFLRQKRMFSLLLEKTDCTINLLIILMNHSIFCLIRVTTCFISTYSLSKFMCVIVTFHTWIYRALILCPRLLPALLLPSLLHSPRVHLLLLHNHFLRDFCTRGNTWQSRGVWLTSLNKMSPSSIRFCKWVDCCPLSG